MQFNIQVDIPWKYKILWLGNKYTLNKDSENRDKI